MQRARCVWGPSRAVARIVSACAAAALAACGGGGGAGSVAVPGVIVGTVVDARSHIAVSNATVSADGAVSRTDVAGGLVLAGTGVGERVVVLAAAEGFAANFEGVTVAEGTQSAVSLMLVPAGLRTMVDAAGGGTLAATDSPASQTLPAGALVRADGTPFSRAAGVQLAAIAAATKLDAMPATVPLCYVDETSGLWVEEGSAMPDPTGSFFAGRVGRLVVWNADRALETIRYTGCVVDESGARVAGARVRSEGVDYSGRSVVGTDANGVFVAPMKRNGRATIAAETGAVRSNTVSTGPSSVAIDGSGSCLLLSGAADSMTIQLSWGERPFDADSHLYFADGNHLSCTGKGSLSSDPYAALDVDDTSSDGPEVVTLRRLMVGTHRYARHNDSRSGGPGLMESPVRVEVNWNGVRRVFTPTPGETSGTD